jgi:hypothetical protein
MLFRTSLPLLTALFLIPLAASAEYAYNPGDFAVEVVGYHAGNSGHVNDYLDPSHDYKDPSNALGRPTVDTTGDDDAIPMDDPAPVNPVYGPSRYHELCTVGYDARREGLQYVHDGTGYLELRFGRKVFDNPLNPYGSDLIVFGNAFLETAGGPWANGDPAETDVLAILSSEPGGVLVSQDGQAWFRLPDPGGSARGADDFAPTLGRVYDPTHPEGDIDTPYWTNHWWGHATNPTLPLDPSIQPGDWQGRPVADVAASYRGSAGGTAVDLADLAPADYAQLDVDPATGMVWIEYVRIEDPKDAQGQYVGTSSEIDALADVFARRGGDASLDGTVDVTDLAILAANWQAEAGVDWQQGLDGWERGDFDADGTVDVTDLAIMAANWGRDNGEIGNGSKSGSVPEPTTLAILAAGILAWRRRPAETSCPKR